jgi:hypothetical protein
MNDRDREFELDLALVPTVLHLVQQKLRLEGKKSRRQRRWWVQPWLSRRNYLRAYKCLLQELRTEDLEEYFKFLRMEPRHLDWLLSAVRVAIEKKNTIMRKSIKPGERLAVTLRFLAFSLQQSSVFCVFSLNIFYSSYTAVCFFYYFSTPPLSSVHFGVRRQIERPDLLGFIFDFLLLSVYNGCVPSSSRPLTTMLLINH